MTSRTFDPSSTARSGTCATDPTAARRAFTLVELITVMAILSVLVAMIVGAARGIQERQRTAATQEMLLGLKAALQRYAAAYSEAYPWTADVRAADNRLIMRNVTTTMGLLNEWSILFPGTPQVAPASTWLYYEEAILYAALMSPLRGGPFARALASRACIRADSSGNKFTLFADGWDRPITYDYVPTGSKYELMLKSQGSNPDSNTDDITVYVFQYTAS